MVQWNIHWKHMCIILFSWLGYYTICTQYQENLDILQTMLDKYVDSYTAIICGDMNGSLSNERNNSHDVKLKSFMRLNKFHLHTDVRNQPTFYHHDGKSKS
jgi:hypothetical protein